MELILGKIFESEDLESLRVYKEKVLDIDKEIIDRILKTKTFSAASLFSISKKHALRYVALCNTEKKQQIDEEVLNHVVKIQNQYDE